MSSSKITSPLDVAPLVQPGRTNPQSPNQTLVSFGTMDGMRYCDDDTCPASHQEHEIVMHCQDLQLQPSQRDNLCCEFEDGSTVKATWDDEGQTASCPLPKVRL